MSFLKHVSPLAAWAFGCYSVLITLPVIKKTNKQNYVIKAVKIVLEQFKLTKWSCNLQEQLIPCGY